MDAGYASWFAREALQFVVGAKRGGHGVHSPFVYALATEVLDVHQPRQQLHKIESLRQQLCRDTRSVTLNDLGAGSRVEAASLNRSVAQLAKNGARRAASGALLHHLVAWVQPMRALELGTQLGISALYQASALRGKASLTTVEGSAELAAIAHENWAQCPMTPAINSVVSPFDAFLGQALEPWDYVLLDGHHDEAATLRYFEMLLPQLTEGACVVLDDIRWSRGMHRAWQRVQEHPEVSVSVDLFRMGIAFVRRPQAKEHFCLWPGFRIFMGQ